MPLSLDNRRLLLGAFIDLAFCFDSDRRKAALFDGLPEQGRGYGLPRFKGYPALARIQVDLNLFYTVNAFDRTLHVVHSERSRQTVDVDDGIRDGAHGKGRRARRLPSRRTSNRQRSRCDGDNPRHRHGGQHQANAGMGRQRP